MSLQVLLLSMKVWRSLGWFRSASFRMLKLGTTPEPATMCTMWPVRCSTSGGSVYGPVKPTTGKRVPGGQA